MKRSVPADEAVASAMGAAAVLTLAGSEEGREATAVDGDAVVGAHAGVPVKIGRGTRLSLETRLPRDATA